MDHFEYVMVLISIIIGLGIAHILLGLGGIVDRLVGRGERLKLSVAYAAWLANVFIWLVMFWWWQFRLDELWSDWTVGRYLFLILYSVVVFLNAAILVPRSWDGVSDLGEFFLQRRAWFYSAFIVGTLLDVVDSFLKGGMEYILVTTGFWVWLLWAGTLLVCVAGIRLSDRRFHAAGGIGVIILNALVSFEVLDKLGL